MADKSAASNNNSELSRPIAAEGSETVLPADDQSADKTESVTNTEHTEPHTVGGETASVPVVEGIPGSETVSQAGSEAVCQVGGDTVLTSVAEGIPGDETVSSPAVGGLLGGETVSKAGGEADCQQDSEAVSQEGGETVSQEGGEAVSSLSMAEVAQTSESVMRHSETAVEGTDVSGDTGDVINELMNKSTTSGGPVDSTGTSPDQDFLALTYLVHPPDGSTFERPYLDDFWKCRWVRMEPELRRVLRKSSRLASDVITLDSSSSSCDYDSSEGEFSDEDYEDSMASNSPIFVDEKKKKKTLENNDDDDDEIVLDENSSNAIVLGDDDDEDEVADVVAEDVDEVAEDVDEVAEDVDEIVCSGETIDGDDGNKNSGGDTSIVICDVDNSVDETDEPAVITRPSNIESSANSMVNIESANSMVGTESANSMVNIESANSMVSIVSANSMVGVEDSYSSAVDAEPGVSDETMKVMNGSGDDVVDKPGSGPAGTGDEDKPASGPAETGEDVVRNGSCCVADNIVTDS